MLQVLEKLYIKLLNPFLKVSRRIPVNVKGAGLSICFAGLMAQYVVVGMINRNTLYYSWYMSFDLMMLLGCILFMLGEELKPLVWRKGLTYSFLGMGAYMVLSESLQPKYMPYLGLCLILIIPLFAFVWGNHKQKHWVIQCMSNGIRGAFLLSTLLAFFFRVKMDGYRYAGLFINPNMLGLFLVPVAIVYLMEIDKMLKTTGSKIRKTILLLEVGLCFFMILMTQARTTLLAILLTGGIWFLIRMVQFRREKKLGRFLGSIGLLFLVIVISYPAYEKLLQVLPEKTGIQWVYPKDKYYAKINEPLFGSAVLAAEDNAQTDESELGVMDDGDSKEETTGFDRLIGSLRFDSLSSLLNGRWEIYQEYVKGLSWSGHRKMSMKVDNSTVPHAHNNMLQQGYMYGIGAMILFGIITILSIGAAINNCLRLDHNNSYHLFIVLYFIIHLLIGITEMTILPFIVVTGMIFYLLVALVMVKDNDSSQKELFSE